MAWRMSSLNNEAANRPNHTCRAADRDGKMQLLMKVDFKRVVLITRHSSRCWLEAPAGSSTERPLGRPRRNWLQQLEEDTGLSVGAAWIAGQDRSMWRTLRPSAGQAQQWVSEWCWLWRAKKDCPHLRNEYGFGLLSNLKSCRKRWMLGSS